MRVLLADKLADVCEHRLTRRGMSVITEVGLDADGLVRAIAEHDPDVVVVRSTIVTAAHIHAGRNLALVIRAGAGVNTIDLDAASRHGVFVANCPGRNALAVAELAIGLIVALDRRIPDNVAEARAGRWNKKGFSAAHGLAGRTLGLVGLGPIGEATARRARGLGMDVVAWSRSLTPERAAASGIRYAASPVEVARQSRVLSIHLALTPQTRGLVSADVLEALPEGALLVNTARAEIVDEQALVRALDARRLRAALDVFSGEPSGGTGSLDHPLAHHPGVYLTHHIGASTDQAQESVAVAVADIVEKFTDTGEVIDCVNLAMTHDADACLVVRHKDRVGVLARVLNCLGEAHHNIQGMENTIFAGGEAACARIEVAGSPSPALLERIGALEHVLNVSSMALYKERS